MIKQIRAALMGLPVPWGEESHHFIVLFPSGERSEEEDMLRKRGQELESSCWHLMEGPGSKERP